MIEEYVQSIYDTCEKKKPYVSQKPRWLSDMHIHKEYEFILVRSGAIRCITPSDDILINAGDLLFINSNIPHKTFDVVGNNDYVLLRFNSPMITESVMRYVVRFAKTSEMPVFLFKHGLQATSEITEIVMAVSDEKSKCLPMWREHVQAYILLILAKLKRFGVLSVSEKFDNPDMDKVRPVIEYINENFAEDISTAFLAQLLNFNETYFCRVFKRAVGTTALNYLNYVRICKAEHLLRKGKNISTVACETGFASISYFNRVFKKFKLYSPREYRELLEAEVYPPHE